jgi:hypothetical protein
MSERRFDRDAKKRRGTIVYTYRSPGLIKAENEIENEIRAIESKRKLQAARRRYWALGHTGPKPWFDSWPQGGNANPRRKRKEYPSGHHNCGFYRL